MQNPSALTQEQFQVLLHDEEACISFITKLKWPHGYVCSRCLATHAYVIRTRRLPLYECRACRHQTSPIANTVMEGSRTSLCKWFTAIWLLTRPDSINAVQLSTFIGVTYKTAWLMLHKIRIAINHADNMNQLSGDVHAILALCGYNPMRRFVSKHTPVVVAQSATPDAQTEIIKMKLTSLANSADNILSYSECQHFCELHIAPSSPAPNIIRHFYRVSRRSPIYLILQQARKWLNNTFHGIGRKYLQLYLDEYCLRINTFARYSSDLARVSSYISILVSSSLAEHKLSYDPYKPTMKRIDVEKISAA